MSRKRPSGQPSDDITSVVLMVTGALVIALAMRLDSVAMGAVGGVILGIGCLWDVRGR